MALVAIEASTSRTEKRAIAHMGMAFYSNPNWGIVKCRVSIYVV